MDETRYDAQTVHLLETGNYGSLAFDSAAVLTRLVSETYRVFGVQDYTNVLLNIVFIVFWYCEVYEY